MDNRRLLLLFVFSFSVFVLWDSWQKYNQPPPPPAIEQSAAVPANASPVPGTTAAVASSASVPTAPTVGKGEIIRVKTDLFEAEISTQGGDIVGLALNNYKALKNKEYKFKLF